MLARVPLNPWGSGFKRKTHLFETLIQWHGSINTHMRHPLACYMFPVPEVCECDSPQMWRCYSVYVESD